MSESREEVKEQKGQEVTTLTSDFSTCFPEIFLAEFDFRAWHWPENSGTSITYFTALHPSRQPRLPFAAAQHFFTLHVHFAR